LFLRKKRRMKKKRDVVVNVEIFCYVGVVKSI